MTGWSACCRQGFYATDVVAKGTVYNGTDSNDILLLESLLSKKLFKISLRFKFVIFFRLSRQIAPLSSSKIRRNCLNF